MRSTRIHHADRGFGIGDARVEIAPHAHTRWPTSCSRSLTANDERHEWKAAGSFQPGGFRLPSPALPAIPHRSGSMRRRGAPFAPKVTRWGKRMNLSPSGALRCTTARGGEKEDSVAPHTIHAADAHQQGATAWWSERRERVVRLNCKEQMSCVLFLEQEAIITQQDRLCCRETSSIPIA